MRIFFSYKTNFTNIIFIVYDFSIRGVEWFKSSFEKQENVFVQVIKH
jgi:hypothetical protein